MWKEQLVLLALLAALFLPASSQSPFDDNEINDECHLKTSIVLDKLDTFEREKIKDDFKRNQLWTDVVKETIGAMTKQHQEESKSQMEQLTNKLEKIDRKMDVLQSQTIKAEQAQNKSDGCIDDLNKQTKIISEHLKKVEKIEKKLESVRTLVQDIALYIKPIPICERWLQTLNLNRTHFFSSEGKYFYFNKTLLTWNGAHDWCAEREMQLAMIKTTSQMDAVVKELKKHTPYGYYWLDASDVGQLAGQFRWADGTLVDGTTWRNGKISQGHGDLNERTCVGFHTADARLSDARCSLEQRILCQVPAALAACL